MEKTVFRVCFNNIKVNISQSGVLSEKADVCVVPQYKTGISLTGVCAAFIHSEARNSIIAFQDFVNGKTLDPSTAFIAPCNGNNYQNLIHIPVLASPSKETKEETAQNTFIGTLASLTEANKIKAKKVVIPSMNTGSNGLLSYEDAAIAIYMAIDYFSENTNEYIKEITIPLMNKEAFFTFIQTLCLI